MIKIKAFFHNFPFCFQSGTFNKSQIDSTTIKSFKFIWKLNKAALFFSKKNKESCLTALSSSLEVC